VQALILAGGSGTRFWPLSRRRRPKQLLALEGERSLLRETLERLRPIVPPESVWVATTRILADEVRRELPEVPPEQVLAEPVGRNTAPAIGWAVRSMPEAARQGVVAVLPADHRMADAGAFRHALARAARFAGERDAVMTLGVVPRWAETGYGYLELGEDLGDGVRRVRRFVEKPTPEKAAAFLAAGTHLWNAGIFLFRGATLLAHLARFEPEMAEGLERIAAAPADLDEVYPRLPAKSIDYAVMERLERLERLETLATVPLDCGWSDLGSWEALAEVLPQDASGNAVRGEVLAVEAGGNLLYAEGGTVAVLGVRDLAVVRTDDAVLVLPRERSQEVRRIIDELAARGRDDLL
jgi:mannose-1-phosphate guanylyltransferase